MQIKFLPAIENSVYNVLIVLFLLTIPVWAQESSATDDIVVKAANVIIFEMTANLKLTQDQVSAVKPIVADNIAKVRNLQQSLEAGNIDSSTMYDQRQQLTKDENQELSLILTSDQMKVCIDMQNESYSPSRHSSLK